MPLAAGVPLFPNSCSAAVQAPAGLPGSIACISFAQVDSWHASTIDGPCTLASAGEGWAEDIKKLALVDGSGEALGHLYLDLYSRWRSDSESDALRARARLLRSAGCAQ